jgi:hypothetical protein
MENMAHLLCALSPVVVDCMAFFVRKTYYGNKKGFGVGGNTDCH